MKRQFLSIRKDRVAVRRKLPLWMLLLGLFGFAAIPLVIYFDTLLAPVDTGFNILWVFLYGVLCSGGILGAIFYWFKCRRPDCINHLKLWRNLSKFYPIQSTIYILFFLAWLRHWELFLCLSIKFWRMMCQKYSRQPSRKRKRKKYGGGREKHGIVNYIT